MVGELTVNDHKKIDPQYSKSFSDLIVRVLEAALHDCCVYLYYDDTA